MPQILITTQYLENYAFPDWDGDGLCPEHWKPKDSSTYALSVPENITGDELEVLFGRLALAVCYNNLAACESEVARQVLPTGRLTPGEEYFEELLASGLAEESDRVYYAPIVLTLEAVENAIMEKTGVPATAE